MIICDGYNLGRIIGAVLLRNQVHHSSSSELQYYYKKRTAVGGYDGRVPTYIILYAAFPSTMGI